MSYLREVKNDGKVIFLWATALTMRRCYARADGGDARIGSDAAIKTAANVPGIVKAAELYPRPKVD